MFSREYDPLRSSARQVAYNRHAISPRLILPSRAAWALAFEAQRRRIHVGDLIEELLATWVDGYLAGLAEGDRNRFVESIPFSRGPYRKARQLAEAAESP